MSTHIFLEKQGASHHPISQSVGDLREKRHGTYSRCPAGFRTNGHPYLFLKMGCITLPGTLRISRSVRDLRKRGHGTYCRCPAGFRTNGHPYLFFKSGVPHTTRYPEDVTKCWGSKRKKDMVHNAGARQVSRKYGHPYIFLKKRTTHHPAVKWSLKKLGTQYGFFYGHSS